MVGFLVRTTRLHWSYRLRLEVGLQICLHLPPYVDKRSASWLGLQDYIGVTGSASKWDYLLDTFPLLAGEGKGEVEAPCIVKRSASWLGLQDYIETTGSASKWDYLLDTFPLLAGERIFGRA